MSYLFLFIYPVPVRGPERNMNWSSYISVLSYLAELAYSTQIQVASRQRLIISLISSEVS